MKHAIYAPTLNDYADPKRLVTLAVESERAGFDGFFIYDVLVMEQGWEVADATVTLGAIAQATQRIRIGAMITPIARRRPWKLAKELVTLDHLSGGRVTLGIGLGEPAEIEFGNFGDDPSPKGRAERLDEGLAILDPLMRGVSVNFHGKHFDVRDTRLAPRCVQSPRIPIWGGAALPAHAGVRRAARWDGLFPILFPDPPVKRDDGSWDWEYFWLDPEGFAALVKATLEYRAAFRAELGSSGFDFVASGDTRNDSAEQARAKIAAFESAGATWWLEWIDDRVGSYETSLNHVRRGPAHKR